MQIKTTMRYHFTSVRTTIIKKNTDNKCLQASGEMGTLVLCWWECKFVEPLWKTVGRFLKKQTNKQQQQKTPEIPFGPAISPLGIYLKKIKTLLLKDTFTSVFKAALFTMKM